MKKSGKTVLRNFIIELIVYAFLVVLYFLLVLRFLGEPLAELNDTRPLYYAIVALALIVAQGFVLEIITSLLMRILGFGHVE